MIKEILYKDEVFTWASVDDEDQDILDKSWFVNIRTRGMPTKYFQLRRNLTYAERSLFGKTKMYLHHEIWIKHFGPIPEGMSVDHIDFNTANNKKDNLRLLPDQANKSRHQKQGAPNGQQMDQTITSL